MNKMQNHGKGKVVRMEKKATNHFGLIVLLLIAIAGGGYGGYYLYEHRDEFNWDFKNPLKEEETEDEKKSTNINKSNKDLMVPRLRENNITPYDEELVITKITATTQGYEITVAAQTDKEESLIYYTEKILIDGYNTSAEFEVVDTLEPPGVAQKPTEKTFRIDKTELDALGMYSFANLTFYYRRKTEEGVEQLTRRIIRAYSDFNFDNSRKGLVKIDEKNEVIVSYYQTLEDSKTTYIYFDFKNEKTMVSNKVRIKKLLINGEIYNYSKFNEEVYSGSETILCIEIPKDKIKEVNNFNVSFILIEDYKEEEKQSMYITSDYYKEFK